MRRASDEWAIERRVTRRQVLAGAAGVAGFAAIPTLLAACGPAATATPSSSAAPVASAPSSSASAAASTMPSLAGVVHVGSYYSGAGEAAGQQAVDTGFADATGIQIQATSMDRSAFQDGMPRYLAGRPDTAFTWFAGYQMRSFAARNLTVPLDDVWSTVKSNFADGVAQAVTGSDGKVYGVPVSCYPWVVFYRKSLFSDKGYALPKTWADLKSLCTKMQHDGLVPIAFANQEGWPALGTFDSLDLRLNGYDFHTGLLSGKLSWTDPKVTAVFEKWREIIPYQSKDSATRTWTEAAASLLQKASGMYLLGPAVADVFGATHDPSDLKDLDCFAFPSLGTPYDSEASLDAQVEVWQLAARSPDLDVEELAAKAYLEYWVKGSTEGTFYQHVPHAIPVAKDADTSTYSDLEKKYVQLVGAAARVAQSFDRDTRPDFASPEGMPRFIKQFLADPAQDLAGLQASIQAYWDSLPPEA